MEAIESGPMNTSASLVSLHLAGEAEAELSLSSLGGQITLPRTDAALTPYGGLAAWGSFLLEDYGQPQWIESVRRLNPFDVIVSGFSIHHQTYRRKRELYAELFQLLRPGGIFLNVEHVASPSKWVEQRFEDLFIDALQEFNRRKGPAKTRAQITREFFRRPDKHANILAPVERQCEWLREIGYRDVDCYFKIFELAVFGGRK